MDHVDETFVSEVTGAYREAIEANPQDWQLRYNFGALLHQLGRCDEAAGSWTMSCGRCRT